MKPLTCLVLILFISFHGLCQEESCGTTYEPDPYFDVKVYNEFKEKFFRNYGLRNQAVTYLPLRINIIRHDDQSGGFDPSLVAETLDTANARYLDMGIQFELCGSIRYIDRDILYDFDRALYLDTLVSYNESGVINVYYINKVLSGDSQICGFASFPWYDQEYVVLKNSCAINGSTLAHELGHYFGIYHTHTTINGTELADGSNCVFAGDEFCDTPADPRLGISSVNSDCEYTGQGRDANGDRYEPDPKNIMSYSRKECRTYFSPEQSSRMKFYQETQRDHLISCAVTSNKVVDPSVLEIFPNPVYNKLNLKIEIPYTVEGISLYTLDGRLQTVFMGNDQPQQLQVDHLNPGIYLLSIMTDAGIINKRFIKR